MDEDSIEDLAGDQLDQEIEDLKAQVKSLKARRALQVANIISASSTEGILLDGQSSNSSSVPNESNPLLPSLINHTKKQLAHNQECLYRFCAGITTFKVHDPDPNAVDNGNVLGIRIEAFASGKFLTPYYVFLNKPFAGSQCLRIHRHTFPPLIPLAALAARYLPTPAAGKMVEKTKKQHLSRFVRSLRRETAAYQNRTAVIVGMRKAFGIHDKKASQKGKGKELGIRDTSAADAEARQIRIEWVDGRIGRVLIGPKGDVEKCVVVRDEGRDREMERKVLGGNGRAEGLVQRMLS
ncbi:MAG: hypothetical protein M1818_002788 [Claussenomyces sp. TS43310]|nr:MAG: hypothetical protein M1818_002788 [Claussenomyces sp. TS43310]